ncbi:MAG: UDP-N-acetylmuramate dehydrogenase [Polyangiaceae bacterium]
MSRRSRARRGHDANGTCYERAVTETLAALTTLGVGGQPQSYTIVSSDRELELAVAEAKRAGLRVLVLGGGSNLVVADSGIDGCVVDLRIRGLTFGASPPNDQSPTETVIAGAGESWDDFVAAVCARNLAGVECLSGIPGSVGATPIQNVGAYGQEVADTLKWVEAFDLENGCFKKIAAADCEFAYRSSRFKHREAGRWVVTRVAFELERGGAPKLEYAELKRAAEQLQSISLDSVRELVIKLRRGKSMVLDPKDPNRRSCGSFFTNPIVIDAVAQRVSEKAASLGHGTPPTFPQGNGTSKLSAGWLIERAGLAKGTRDGNVGLSTKHTLAIVAHDGASAADVVRFAWRVRETVEAFWGVRLVPEPVFWGFAELHDGLPPR